ncbi:MAG: hypothetical protein ACRCZS_23615 [Chroococcidiopsis sp.]
MRDRWSLVIGHWSFVSDLEVGSSLLPTPDSRLPAPSAPDRSLSWATLSSPAPCSCAPCSLI